MPTVYVPDSQQSRSMQRLGFFDLNTLRAGHAVSLRSRSAMLLTLVASSGPAWVTFTQPPSPDLLEAEDLLLVAGQALRVQPGQHLVMEPLGEQAVRYQWETLNDR